MFNLELWARMGGRGTVSHAFKYLENIHRFGYLADLTHLPLVIYWEAKSRSIATLISRLRRDNRLIVVMPPSIALSRINPSTPFQSANQPPSDVPINCPI